MFLSSLQQQQPGLISRVTDTVKSIVPSWLQKYFRNGEAAEGGGAVPEAGQDQAPPSNGNEDMTPPLDGRDSPEPTTSNTGEICHTGRRVGLVVTFTPAGQTLFLRV